MKNKKQNPCNDPPEIGDLVEIGHDYVTGKPFIGVVTEINHKVGEGSITGSVLVNETVRWVDLYKLKLVKRKTEKKNENA